MFDLQANYKPAGDQIPAIKKIIEEFEAWQKNITLLGATGTGKTFTMANIIQKFQKPTLVISHNKTLAAQLATEFKYFFPNNAVHYFVSYFDYYQPESYLPDKDVYIEKEATINKEIEMYRLGTLASLLSREDVIVVASVSALYGLGQKEFFEKYSAQFKVWQEYDRTTIKKQLISMQYKLVASKIEQGMFEFKWEILDIYSSTENILFRLFFNEDTLEMIHLKDPLTFQDKGTKNYIIVWPSSQYLQDMSDLQNILFKIENEMNLRIAEFSKDNKILEANRIEKRVKYDTRMIKETGFVNGIENYSIYFDGRMPGDAPNTIFDYFPEDMMMIVDESHMSIPQLKAMPQADKSRKTNLINHGFRLPSAIDHRPLNFEELEQRMGWKDNNLKTIKAKTDAKTLFVSATPAPYEFEHSGEIVEQIIRPTGLLDPVTYVYPKSGDYDHLLTSVDTLLKKKPHVSHLFKNFEVKKEIDLEEIFE